MSLTPFDGFFYRPFHRQLVHWPLTITRRRGSEAGNEFYRFVGGVDDRYSGILARVHAPEVIQDEQGSGEQAGESSKPNRYHMNLAVQDFKPEDIKVKVQGNNVIVEAKREKKNEQEGMYAHSFCQFKRTFPLPEGVDKMQLQSYLSSGGILELDAPIFAPATEAHPEGVSSLSSGDIVKHDALILAPETEKKEKKEKKKKKREI